MPSERDPVLEPAQGTELNRFASRKDAFRSGLKDASGAPAMVLFAGMVGFGAMGKTSGFDLSFTALSSLLMFALPGQVVLMEMMVDGASLAGHCPCRNLDLNPLYHHDHHLVSATRSA
jgi:hypothetical protein